LIALPLAPNKAGAILGLSGNTSEAALVRKAGTLF
jgi:hypothetical protein